MIQIRKHLAEWIFFLVSDAKQRKKGKNIFRFIYHGELRVSVHRVFRKFHKIGWRRKHADNFIKQISFDGIGKCQAIEIKFFRIYINVSVFFVAWVNGMQTITKLLQIMAGWRFHDFFSTQHSKLNVWYAVCTDMLSR